MDKMFNSPAEDGIADSQTLHIVTFEERSLKNWLCSLNRHKRESWRRKTELIMVIHRSVPKRRARELFFWNNVSQNVAHGPPVVRGGFGKTIGEIVPYTNQIKYAPTHIYAYAKPVFVTSTRPTCIIFLQFTGMHFWRCVWRIYGRGCSACAPTASEVVRDYRKSEKQLSKAYY
jgi:hypothetical protein